MSGKSTFNWCFIGAGTLANTVAGEILSSEWHKVATVYTHTPRKCRDFAGSGAVRLMTAPKTPFWPRMWTVSTS